MFDVFVSKGKRLLRRLIIAQRSTIKISRFSKIIGSSKCFHVLPKSHNRNVLVFLEIELYSNISKFSCIVGGSVAELSARQTGKPVVPGSSPALTTIWICFTVAPSSNSRLKQCYLQFELFVSVVCSVPQAFVL